MHGGGAINGRVTLARGCWPWSIEVRATDPHGITMTTRLQYLVSQEFALPGLWPGEWTVTLRSGEDIMASAKVTIRGTEKVRCNLTCKPLEPQ